MNLDGLYEGEYNQSNYTDSDGMRTTFERITNLPPEGSDNTGRVRRIESFWQQRYDSPPATQRRLLDIGSGLAVFPFAMKNHGWLCTALDPDPVAVQHARDVAGVEAVGGSIEDAELEPIFDLVTLNKVLEHVPDPITMLSRCKQFLSSNGLVYIEVPDGEMASIEGKGREEFFIDHFHVFSFASLALLASRAGFVPMHIERLREPSTKYTLRAFLRHP
jgi:2-polyprenyl-3-methyl-5-hydroxy-6-metoxy-1,4-benzoquinol methylase